MNRSFSLVDRCKTELLSTNGRLDHQSRFRASKHEHTKLIVGFQRGAFFQGPSAQLGAQFTRVMFESLQNLRTFKEDYFRQRLSAGLAPTVPAVIVAVPMGIPFS